MIDVSVIIAVYNHENYIKQAINSVLKQKVSFDYEVLIGEDHSPDNSRKVLMDLQPHLPSNFHIYYREKNMGALNNFYDLYSRMKGKYFIVLEGDDYWIDENKLQEEYDYLESHPKCIEVAHNTVVVDKDSNIIKGYQYPECHNSIYRLRDFRNGLLAGQTTTCLKRNFYTMNLFDRNIDVGSFKAGDKVTNFLLFANGDIHCIQKKMSAYRYVTSSGSSFSATQKKDLHEYDDFYKGILKYCNTHQVRKGLKKIVLQMYGYYSLKNYIKTREDNYLHDFKHCLQEAPWSVSRYLFCEILKFPMKKAIYIKNKSKVRS